MAKSQSSGKQSTTCNNCGDGFEYYLSQQTGQYCSHTCRKEDGYNGDKIAASLTAESGENADEFPWRRKDTLRRMYVKDEMSAIEIADELGSTVDTVYKWMERHGIDRRNLEEAALERDDEGAWITHYYDSDGYEVCQASTSEDYDGRITIHRLVAIAEGADPHEVMGQSGLDVHHINGIPWDNRPSNLEPVDNAKHNALNRLFSLPEEDAEEVIMLYRQRTRAMETR